MAYELEYITQKDFYKGVTICKDIAGQLSGFIAYLKGSRLKGEKFRTKYKSMKDEMAELLSEVKAQKSKFKENENIEP